MREENMMIHAAIASKMGVSETKIRLTLLKLNSHINKPIKEVNRRRKERERIEKTFFCTD